MSIALNETARGPAIKAAKRNIMEQVNFPEGYLDTRIAFVKAATPDNLEARIKGRDRPTSLARFASGAPVVQRGSRTAYTGGVNVMVKPGAPQRIPTGFLVGLRHGNVGFAIRTKSGVVHGVQRYKPQRLFPNVYLLYGPSVDQVLTDVGDQISEEVTSDIAAEFNRQFARLSGLG
jgi:hypothetical protein